MSETPSPRPRLHPLRGDPDGPSRRLPRLVALALLVAALPWALQARDADPTSQPIELGKVRWGRDLPKALAEADRTGRPIFLLFQEVPGCATCVGFGESVLSHPRVISAIETLFVPLAIHNNKRGADRDVLERFGEPSWNNPVVRFVDAQGQDLIPRKDGVWTRPEIVARMVRALEAAGRPVPDDLRALGPRADAVPQRATLAMHCFWTGEACLGGVDGVVSTRPGWLGGREVVEVHFDATRLSYEELLGHASRQDCADHVYAHDETQLRAANRHFGTRVTHTAAIARDAKASDDKRYLRRSSLRHLDLSAEQRTKINAALAQGRDPLAFLSDAQRTQLEAERPAR